MAEAAQKWKRLPDERPGQIINAALNTFSIKGLQSTTMDEIAQAAGITKGTIYLYFSSKEELFVEMVRVQINKALELLPAAEIESFENPEELTARLGKEFMDVLMTPEIAKVIPLVVAEVNHLDSLKALYREEILPKANFQLAKILELGVGMGVVKPLDPVIAARALLGMFFIFVLTQEVFAAKEITPMRTADIADTVATIFFQGIAKKESE